jgi:CYTH domain-containing protein
MKQLETERKFLVIRELWTTIEKPEAVPYIQGYLCIDEDKVIRARVAGSRGFLTIKGKSDTLSHPEFEYEIPSEEAFELIREYAAGRIEKTRTKIHFGKHLWEVDEFLGDNEGLLMAEIELDAPGEVFDMPGWAGEEVTGDRRYYNSYLSRVPYQLWEKKNEQ